MLSGVPRQKLKVLALSLDGNGEEQLLLLKPDHSG